MRRIATILFLLLLTNNSLFAQSTNFSDADAINIFKTYPPKWGFEGVYEILYRSNLGSSYDFSGQNKKICFYSYSNNIYAKIIDFNTSDYDYNFYKAYLQDAFWKVDLYGTLTHSVHYSWENAFREKNELQTTKVYQKDESLFFEVSTLFRSIAGFQDKILKMEILLKKIYSPEGIKRKPEAGSSSFGTGFLVSNKDFLITNYHVIEDAKRIFINLNNGNKLECTLVADDKENDLALLKIKGGDDIFQNTKPFKFNFKTSEVGAEVFTLGYPMIDKMGTEIKVTNGIISSNSGYQGDKTTYQITVPIQPGNSGGPLFNNNGEVIGITNSKLKGAENASYAIKSIFLNSLIANEGITFNNPTNNLNVAGLSLPEKIKILKNNVFIVFCEY